MGDVHGGRTQGLHRLHLAERDAGEVLDLTDRNTDHVGEGDVAGAAPGCLGTGQDQQRLGVASHTGREMVQAKQVLELVRVLLVRLEPVDELDLTVEEGLVAPGQVDEDVGDALAQCCVLLRGDIGGGAGKTVQRLGDGAQLMMIVHIDLGEAERWGWPIGSAQRLDERGELLIGDLAGGPAEAPQRGGDGSRDHEGGERGDDERRERTDGEPDHGALRVGERGGSGVDLVAEQLLADPRKSGHACVRFDRPSVGDEVGAGHLIGGAESCERRVAVAHRRLSRRQRQRVTTRVGGLPAKHIECHARLGEHIRCLLRSAGIAAGGNQRHGGAPRFAIDAVLEPVGRGLRGGGSREPAQHGSGGVGDGSEHAAVRVGDRTRIGRHRQVEFADRGEGVDLAAQLIGRGGRRGSVCRGPILRLQFAERDLEQMRRDVGSRHLFVDPGGCLARRAADGRGNRQHPLGPHRAGEARRCQCGARHREPPRRIVSRIDA